MFPANQLQLKCAGFTDCEKHVAEPAPSVARSKALPHLHSQFIPNYLLQTEEVNWQTGMDEDAPRYHKPAEVRRVPGPPQ